MARIVSSRLPVLAAAAALCLVAVTPAQATNAKKPDCWKVPGHPDCLNPPYPGYSNSHLTTRQQTPPQVPAPPGPTK